MASSSRSLDVGLISDTHGLMRPEALDALAGSRHIVHAGDPIDIDVVVAGHPHRPREERRGGVLFVNPGSAGPRRFKLPVAVARLRISGKRVRFELVPL